MNTAAAPPPAPDAAPPLSEAQRIVNVFVAPSKTFRDLRRRAGWWIPWILTSLVVVIFFQVVVKQIGYQQLIKSDLARSPKRAEAFEKLPPDQQARQMEIATAITRYIGFAQPFFVLVGLLVMAGVLMATFKFALNADVSFARSMAIVAYGGLPGLIAILLGIVSLFSGVDPEGFNARNPAATNPAYFMNPLGNKLLYSMASALDIFVIWCVILIGLGFAIDGRVKATTAIFVVAGWYLVYKLTLGLVF